MRLRFASKTFFIGWLLVAIIVGWWMHSFSRHRRAINAIRQAGGGVSDRSDGVHRLFPFYSPISIDVRSVKIDETIVRSVKQFSRIENLRLAWDSAYRTEIGDVVACSNVNHLELDNATDDILPFDRRVQSVTHLAIHGTRFTGANLSELISLSKLETLDLSNSAVGDDHVFAISLLPTLKVLCLDQTAITDDGIRSVQWSNLKSLEHLSADCRRVSGESVKHLVGLGLKSIKLFAHSKDTVTGRPKYEVYFPGCDFKWTILLDGGMDDIMRVGETSNDPFGGDRFGGSQ